MTLCSEMRLPATISSRWCTQTLTARRRNLSRTPLRSRSSARRSWTTSSSGLIVQPRIRVVMIVTIEQYLILVCVLSVSLSWPFFRALKHLLSVYRIYPVSRKKVVVLSLKVPSAPSTKRVSQRPLLYLHGILYWSLVPAVPPGPAPRTLRAVGPLRRGRP
ncbi:hypothetical protein DFH94DRAFT_177949 [Russula ochroleuca]|uniref:Uncharacterized protein n=1 Tax=Russula ochroleuca TaxID=152965 RepID=A0A9P5TDT9_9AGAM|nr:hypothetical protein DFH94DRAFT_177949 [Russula ochroleuca]